MRQVTLADRLRYQFDNTLSRGTTALLGWLFLLSAAFIVTLSLLVAVAGVAVRADGTRLGLVEIIWLNLMHSIDPGTVAGDTGGWPFLLSMLVVTIGGIFTISMLIGLLTSGVQTRLEELRKGRSLVVEQNHVVILGWSPEVFTTISELIVASANKPQLCVAVLADKDKIWMEDEIRARVGRHPRVRIVCRTGSPIDLDDLAIVSPHDARSIIILAPETENPDSHVIKTILALTNNPNRRAEPHHIVAELRDAANIAAARLVGKDEAELVLVSDLIARIIAQTCRQSGLSVIYTELLDFGGDEIYFHEEPALIGETFAEALFAYEDSTVIGLSTGDGNTRLNPSMETVIRPGEKIIVIAEDDDTIQLAPDGEVRIDHEALREPAPAAPAPERTVILGWNYRAPLVIDQLDHYVAPGSELIVVADDEAVAAEIAELKESLRAQHVTFYAADTTDRQVLERLAVREGDHVIVLSYLGTLPPQEADARTLITLLHLREIADQKGHDFSIVSEMLDIRNRALAEIARADDFIVSDKMVSLVLAQIAENKHLARVLADLFDPEGSEIYLKPAADYVALEQPVNFYTVVEAARRRGEVAIGFKIGVGAGDPTYGVRINPVKSRTVRFTRTDRIIVLAES